MDTAYVKEHPPPKIAGYKVQYLQFRYLKCLVNNSWLIDKLQILESSTEFIWLSLSGRKKCQILHLPSLPIHTHQPMPVQPV